MVGLEGEGRRRGAQMERAMGGFVRERENRKGRGDRRIKGGGGRDSWRMIDDSRASSKKFESDWKTPDPSGDNMRTTV